MVRVVQSGQTFVSNDKCRTRRTDEHHVANKLFVVRKAQTQCCQSFTLFFGHRNSWQKLPNDARVLRCDQGLAPIASPAIRFAISRASRSTRSRDNFRSASPSPPSNAPASIRSRNSSALKV